MFGAFKCCGVGARMLRSGSAPPMSHGVSAASLDPVLNGGCGDVNAAVLCSGNWSQKRFLRGNGASSWGRNINSQYVIREIERQINRQAMGTGKEGPRFELGSDENPSLCREQEIRKYSRSLRGHQSLLLTSPSPNSKENIMEQEELLAEISKIISDEGPAHIRVKGRKEEAFLKEWIGVQCELRTIRRERLVDYKRKLQLAGEQALKEMEANLKKGMNLDDLDQAIEGALCSQAKAEYSQKHDN